MADNEADIPVILTGIPQVDQQIKKLLQGFATLQGSSADFTTHLEANLAKINAQLSLSASLTKEISKLQKTINAGTPQQQIRDLAIGQGVANKSSAAASQYEAKVLQATLASMTRVEQEIIAKSGAALQKMEAQIYTRSAAAFNALETQILTRSAATLNKVDAAVFNRSSNALGRSDAEVYAASAAAQSRFDASIFNRSSGALARSDADVFARSSRAVSSTESAVYGKSAAALAKTDIQAYKESAAAAHAYYNEQQRLDDQVRNKSLTALAKYEYQLMQTKNTMYGMEIQAEKTSGRFASIFGGANLLDTIKLQAAFMASYKTIQLFFQTIQFGFKYIVDMDKAMFDLQAITASTGGEMKSLQGIIEKVSLTTHFSAVEIAGAAKILAQAGYGVDQIGQALQGVVLLATATGESLETAAGVATSAIAQFNLQTTDMLHVANVLVEAINGTKLTLEQLSLGLQYAGNTASEAGLTFEQTTAILGSMAQSGIKTGSTLGTGLRQVLAELLNPSKKFVKVLEEIHLGIDDVDLKTHTFVEVLQTLQEHGFSVADAFKAFGSRAASAFLALDPKFIIELNKRFEDTNAAVKANDVQMQSLANKWDRFTNSIGLFLEHDSIGFIQFLKDALDGWTDLINYIDQNGDKLYKFTHVSGYGFDPHLPGYSHGAIPTQYGLDPNAFGLSDNRPTPPGPNTTYPQFFNNPLQKSLQDAIAKSISSQEPGLASYAFQGADHTLGLQAAKQSELKFLEEQEHRNLAKEEDNRKRAEAAIKNTQNIVDSLASIFSHINDALTQANAHIDNIIRENSDENSPVYGRFSDAEVSIFKKKQHDIANQQLSNQVDLYPSRIQALQNLLAAQQRAASATAKSAAFDHSSPEELTNAANAEKEVVATKEKILDLTQEQALAQDKLNVALGNSVDVNKSLSEQVGYVLQAYSKQMEVQSQLSYNIQQNITDSLDNARDSFSSFLQSVATGTKSIGQSFRELATSILNSMIKIEADSLAKSFFGKITGFASSFFGGSDSNSLGGDLASQNFPSDFSWDGLYGGGIIRAAGGADVGRDSKLILARPGEGVLRKSAMDMIGKDNFRQLNALGNRRMSDSASNMGMVDRAPVMQTTNVWVVPAGTKPTLTKDDIIATIADDINKGGPTKKLIKTVTQGTM